MRRRTSLLYIFPLVGYLAAILGATLAVGRPGLPAVVAIDKAVHFAEYAVLGVLFTRFHLWLQPRAAVLWQLLTAICFVATVGAFDEFLQSYRPHRYPDTFDLLADISGGMCAAILVLTLRRRSKAKADS